MSTTTLKTLTEKWKNIISYCTRCGSTLFWDDLFRPHVLKLGNNHLLTCLNIGCNLIVTSVPPQCCDLAELDLLRLALMRSGVPDEDARGAALTLSKGNAAA